MLKLVLLTIGFAFACPAVEIAGIVRTYEVAILGGGCVGCRPQREESNGQPASPETLHIAYRPPRTLKSNPMAYVEGQEARG
jgi:hypothetical protein